MYEQKKNVIINSNKMSAHIVIFKFVCSFHQFDRHYFVIYNTAATFSPLYAVHFWNHVLKRF